MIVAALELEVEEYLQKLQHLRDENGHALVVRNGKAEPRTVSLGVGPITLQAPRVDDRRPTHRFTSKILPPYMRRSPRLSDALPVLYLRGLSTGDFEEAIPALLGEDAAGFSASTITRLTRVWQEEREGWSKRPLTGKEYVYVWADGVYSNVRMDDRLCLLVIVGSFFTDPPKMTEPDPAQMFNPSGNFTLTGTSGEPFQLQDLRGKIVLLFFGYTSCPDACPSTLAKLQRAFNLLSEEQIEQLRTVFVSVDPKRDNPKVLNEYVEYFGVNAIGLTGTNGKTTISWMLEQMLTSSGHQVGVIGTVNANVLPFPSFERTSMVPPRKSTSFFVMESPRPVPVMKRVLSFLTR